MLEEFVVFQRSGLILFSWRSNDSQDIGSIATKVTEEILLGGRSGENSMLLHEHGTNPICLQWKLDNNFELIFLVAFVQDCHPTGVSAMLDAIHIEFLTHYKPGVVLCDRFAKFVSEQSRAGLCSWIQSGNSTNRDDKGNLSKVARLDFSEQVPTSYEPRVRMNNIKVPTRENLIPIIQLQSHKGNWLSRLMNESFHENIFQKKCITEEGLNPVLSKMRDSLLDKNVASTIVEHVCADVRAALLGKEVSVLGSLGAAVHGTIRNSLMQTLSPQRTMNLLAQIRSAQAKKRPYTITFIGVNGVGKSTSLSKVAAWLLSNGLSVLVSACDTFRAGAVEQLRTHCQRLEIPLYERGYERDPATIAQEAIVQARRQGIDVVLIDTAGRMQDNEPLMRALSKLISINSPDLVLFVGEALVGNDAVDQIQKFNSALADLDSRGRQRMIDGIIISKFDTIDSKVGAALSMVRASGAPILFVGCGQTYQDLKIPNVGHLLDTLLS